VHNKELQLEKRNLPHEKSDNTEAVAIEKPTAISLLFVFDWLVESESSTSNRIAKALKLHRYYLLQ